MRKVILLLGFLLLSPSVSSAQVNTVSGKLPQLPDTLGPNGGLKVECLGGTCSGGGPGGGITDTDDGTISGGQVPSLMIGLGYYWNGSNWIRIAGTASGINVVCASGCAGGTADTDDGSVATGQSTGINIGLSYIYNGATWGRLTFGQTTMSASLPVTIASNQSAVPASQSGTWTVQPGNTANTTAWLVTGTGGTFPVTGTFWQATQPVSIAANVNTVEVSPTTIINGKTTVTTAGTRVALAGSTTVKGVTVCAIVTNTGLIYMGSNTVASTNGRILNPGECQSIAIANLNTINIDSSVNGEGVTYIAVN